MRKFFKSLLGAKKTPLHKAVTAGNIEKINAFATEGADVNAKNELGETPLHKAKKSYIS